MAALQRLAHHLDVADALEAVVGAAAGELDQMGHQIAPDLVRVDEMGHAELARQRLARRVEVDADDHVGARHACALDHVQPDAAKPNTTTLAPGSTLAV